MTSANAELQGRQAPRILHLPDAPRAQSLGHEAVALAAQAGLRLDPWQELVLDHALALRPDGRWCASDIGLCVSRQNGKGSVIEAMELWALFVNGEQIMHTAHNFKTSSEGFRRIEGLIKRTPQLDAEVKRYSHTNGDEGIELKNGARLMFGTRTKGGARGMTFDRVIADEAMYLTDEQSDALFFTTSARALATPSGTQHFITGSAGTPESIYFGRMRNNALAGDGPSMLWLEWSIDPCTDYCVQPCEDHDQPGSPESWAIANPGLGIRMFADRVESEYHNMSTEGFLRERLGVGDWPVDGSGWTVIGRDSWMARVDETSEIQGRMALAVDTAPDDSFSCISAAGSNAAGLSHVELTGEDGALYDHRPGTDWVVPRIKAMWERQHPYCVVIYKTGPAARFIGELEKAKIKVLTPTSNDYAQACGEFKASVVPKKGEKASLAHIDQAPLNAAVAGAITRKITDMWGWDRQAATVDISPLVASTLALWGLKKSKRNSQPLVMWA